MPRAGSFSGSFERKRLWVTGLFWRVTLRKHSRCPLNTEASLLQLTPQPAGNKRTFKAGRRPWGWPALHFTHTDLEGSAFTGMSPRPGEPSGPLHASLPELVQLTAACPCCTRGSVRAGTVCLSHGCIFSVVDVYCLSLLMGTQLDCPSDA